MTENTTLIKRISTNGGTIYFIKNGNRHILGECDVEIQVNQKLVSVPTIGTLHHGYKEIYFSLVIADRLRHQTHEVKDLLDVFEYEITADLEHADGSMEKVNFRNLFQSEYDGSTGRWEFQVEDPGMIQTLLNFK